jgi:glutamate carboxypeptidase
MTGFALEEYLAHLKPLVNTDCGSRTPEGVASIADRMTEHFESIGWTVTRKTFDEALGPCLEIANKPGASHYDLMISGHMDTVFPPGTAAERPFSTDDKRAYGPGVSDMKGGILNAWYALKGLPQALLDKASILVCLNCDEEIGSPSSQDWLIEKAQQSDAVLVLEAARADGSLVRSRKGNAKYRITFEGLAAHAGSNLTDGISAITEMAHWTLKINDRVDLDKGTTMNVGIVRGGTAINVVPDFAEAIVDLRFWDNTEGEQIHEWLLQMAEKPHLEGCKVRVLREGFKPAMQVTDDSGKLIAEVEAAGQEVGVPVAWQDSGGGSDANFIAAAGVPTLDGLGPVGGGFHNSTEYLELDSVAPRIQLLQAVIRRLAG